MIHDRAPLRGGMVMLFVKGRLPRLPVEQNRKKRENLISLDLRSSGAAMKEHHHCSLLLLISVILLLSFITARADVITLNGDTFTDKVKEKDTAWFVKFCVPWCKHCKNLGTLWEDLGTAMEGEDEIEIGQVDCSTSKPVCDKVDIHSYPTFKLFYDGEEIVKYAGQRNVESLKAFVLEETEKAVAKAHADIDKEL